MARRKYDENETPVEVRDSKAGKTEAELERALPKAKAKKAVELPPLMEAIKTTLGPAMLKRGCEVGTPAELEADTEPPGFIVTGIYPLDYILTGGDGLPLGRTIEIFGNESSGKTALCEFILGKTKQIGGSLHYLDYEKSKDEEHLACYDVGPTDFLCPDLITLEDGWDYIAGVLKMVAARNATRAKNSMDAEPPVLFVWDSLAQAPAEAEVNEKNHEDSHMALVARGMAKGFRKHTRLISESEVLFVVVNQVRDKPGVMVGPKTDTPGGRAAKFAYSIRLKLAMVKTLKRGDVAVGQIVECTTVKNKHHPKAQKATIILSYYRGIDADWSNFFWFQEHGYITAKGNKGFVFKGVDSEPFSRKEYGGWAKTHKAAVKAAVKAIYADLDTALAEPQDEGDDTTSDD